MEPLLDDTRLASRTEDSNQQPTLFTNLMNKLTPVATPRAPRFSPFHGAVIQTQFDDQFGALKDISLLGLACKIKSDRPPVLCGTRIPELRLTPLGQELTWNCGPARVVRIEEPAHG